MAAPVPGIISRFFTGVFRTFVLIVVGIFVLGFFFGSFWTVGAGERGVLLRFGAVTGKVFDEGLYFKIPYADDVKIMDVRILKEQADADSASKDLQVVTVSAALNFRIDSTKVAQMYQEVGPEYKSRLVDPAIQETVKATTAKFTAEELITKREVIRDQMKELIITKLSPYGLVVEDVNIVNFSFSPAFNRAIEEKVTAEQEALAAKNKLERIKFEAEQKVAEAKGKAEATRIESEALKSNPEILQLRALEKWNGILPQVTGGSVPLISIPGISK